MAINWVASTAGLGPSGTSTFVQLAPGGNPTSPGQLLVALLYNDSTTPTPFGVPPGWTLVSQNLSGTSAGNACVAVRVATGRELGAYTFTGAAGMCGVVVQFTGTGGLDGLPAYNPIPAGASTTRAVTPPLVAAGPGDALVTVYGDAGGDTYSAFTPTGATVGQAATPGVLGIAARFAVGGAVPAGPVSGGTASKLATNAYTAWSLLLAPTPTLTLTQETRDPSEDCATLVVTDGAGQSPLTYPLAVTADDGGTGISLTLSPHGTEVVDPLTITACAQSLGTATVTLAALDSGRPVSGTVFATVEGGPVGKLHTSWTSGSLAVGPAPTPPTSFGGPFPPVAGYAAWYDASRMVNQGATDGQVLSNAGLTWVDNSGNLHDLAVIQGTPTYYSLHADRLINGHPVVYFNGDGWVATAATGGGPIAAPQPFTVFVVAQLSLQSGSQSLFGCSANNVLTMATAASWRLSAPTLVIGAVGTVDTYPHVYTVQYTSLTQLSLMRIDGSGVPGLVGVNAGGNGLAASAFVVGNQQNSGTASPWTGPVGEVIVYASALSATDLQAVESYLLAKWS